MSPYILYGTRHSYFTGKLRPYLRYKGIPHREKQVTLWTYQRLILPRTGQRFIPVLLTPEGELLQDTTAIIDALEQRFPERPVYPEGPRQKLATLLLELYADEWFLLPGMHYRWSYKAKQEAYLMQEFGRIAGPWPGPLARAIGRRLSRPFAASLKFLGVTEKTVAPLETWFEQFLADFEAHLTQHDYLLGSRPCLADFALAGPLGAHILRDPYSRQMLAPKAERTLDWLTRINAPQQAEGDFLAEDEVPDTLLPILRHLFAEQWPILEDTARALPAWQSQHPDKTRVSRALGWHEFELGGVKEKRLMFSNALWMMQRPLDAYRALNGDQRTGVDAWLDRVGGRDALQFNPPLRLIRKNYQLQIQGDQA